MEFRLSSHTVRPGVPVVEVWDGGQFIAQLVPGDAPGELRVISKHEIALMSGGGVPDVLHLFIRFWE